MPPKTRRKSARNKETLTESETPSSSEEPEYRKTLEIITRLSQKYLNTGSSTSTSKQGNKNEQEKGYEGDEENTTGSSASSSVGSPYDFEDEPMSEESSLNKKDKKKKKHDKKSDKQIKQKKPQTAQKKISPKPQTKTPKAQNKSVRFDETPKSPLKEKIKFPTTPLPKTPVVALEKLDIQMVEESQRQLRKRKVDTPQTVATEIKVTRKESVDKIKPESKLKGPKMSTSIHLPSKIIPAMVQDTSTPNEIVRTKALRKRGNDSCFGFEDVKRTSLLESPVKRVPITPLSDYASMDTFSQDVSMENSIQKSKPQSPMLFSMEEEDFCDLQVNKSYSKTYKPKKKMPTKKQQVVKSSEWANKIEKMSVEFKEIESFELSIEQD
ncbi:myb-like protein V [Mytilus californianus]|uniref:myb-like protein V n=1 Tax=Mytilus californianus TaxID=6549 RepID=UPI002247166B|nr:myb-like protein V [Mytilus californianus]